MSTVNLSSNSGRNKLLELLAYEGPQIQAEFNKGSISGRGTAQEVADLREGYFRSFIRRYFPIPYKVAKGNVIDTFGAESASVDCLILNPAHPHTVDAHEKFSVIFAEGVDLAIEIKSDLGAKLELERALLQARTVKRLRRTSAPFLSHQLLALSSEAQDQVYRLPSFTFCLKVKQEISETVSDIVEFYRQHAVPLGEQFDYIVVNEVGIISNVKCPEMSKAPGKDLGIFFEHWMDQTIAAFLLRLSEVPHSSMVMSAPILPQYLRGITPNNFLRISDLAC